MMVPTTRSVLLTPNADDNVCACTSRPRGPFYWPIARPDGPEPSRWLRILPSRSASSNTSTARGESLVMAHDELRLYLVDRVHGHADHDQQRGTAKVKVHVQTAGDPGGKMFEKCPHRTVQVVQMDTRDHPFGNERDQNQVQRAHQRDARQN